MRVKPRVPIVRWLGVVLGASSLLLAACGGAGEPVPSAAASVAKATLAPTATAAASGQPSAAASASARPIDPAAPVVSIEASASGNDLVFKADKLAVPAGNVTISFKNADPKMNHELFVYPVQNVTKLMALKRAGQSANEPEFLTDLAGMTGSLAPLASKQIAVTLRAGFYELACYARMKNPDGSTAYVHFDKGQTLTLAATGAGGPDAAIATPGTAISVEMKDPGNGSWVFIPDKLAAKAGDVTFKVTNSMKIAHDFVVYPIGDVSGAIAAGLKSGSDIDLPEPAQSVLEDLVPGKTDAKTVKLAAGTYVMACFMVSRNPDGTAFVHRDMGQRITFVVQ